MENNTAFQSARFEAIKRRQSWYIPCWEDTSKGNGFYVEGMEENVHVDENSRSWEVKVPIEGKCMGFIFENGTVTPATLHCTMKGVKID